MKILETINNALDTVQSIEGILREAREYAAESRQGNGMLVLALETECAQAKRIIDARDKRVTETEVDNADLLKANHALTTERDELKSEITKLCRKITSLESEVAEARGRKTITLGEHNRIVDNLCQLADKRDRRVDELEIENRKLLDQNWSLVEERDAEIAKREALQAELATMRAKSEPVASGIGEPNPGEGFELCEKSEATESCLNTGGCWGAWLDPNLLSFGLRDNDYRFRRPIAKPAVDAETIESPVVPPA